MGGRRQGRIEKIIAGTVRGVENYLEFSTETGDNFDGWLPSLYTLLGVGPNNDILFKLYESCMYLGETNRGIMKRSKEHWSGWRRGKD